MKLNSLEDVEKYISKNDKFDFEVEINKEGYSSWKDGIHHEDFYMDVDREKFYNFLDKINKESTLVYKKGIHHKWFGIVWGSDLSNFSTKLKTSLLRKGSPEYVGFASFLDRLEDYLREGLPNPRDSSHFAPGEEINYDSPENIDLKFKIFENKDASETTFYVEAIIKKKD